MAVIVYSDLVNSIDRNIPARVQEFRGNLTRSDIEIDASQMTPIGTLVGSGENVGSKLVLMPVKWNTTIKEATFTFGAGSTSRSWKLDLVLLRRERNVRNPSFDLENIANFELIGEAVYTPPVIDPATPATSVPNTIIGSMTVSADAAAGAKVDLLATLSTVAVTANKGLWNRASTLQELVKIVTTEDNYKKFIPEEVFKSENIYLGLNVTIQATTAEYTGSAMITITTVEGTPAALGTKATYKAPVVP
jgi:hypothetical protein